MFWYSPAEKRQHRGGTMYVVRGTSNKPQNTCCVVVGKLLPRSYTRADLSRDEVFREREDEGEEDAYDFSIPTRYVYSSG